MGHHKFRNLNKEDPPLWHSDGSSILRSGGLLGDVLGVEGAPLDELLHGFRHAVLGPEFLVVLLVELREEDVHLRHFDLERSLNGDSLVLRALERLFVEALGELREAAEHLGVEAAHWHSRSPLGNWTPAQFHNKNENRAKNRLF